MVDDLTSAVVPNAGTPEFITLTTEQKSLVRDIVLRFDTNNLSHKDREEIRSELKEADIGPSRALFNELKKAGIAPSAPETHRSRPPGGPPPDGHPRSVPPPKEAQSKQAAEDDEESMLQNLLYKVLGRYDVENLSPKEVDQLKDDLTVARSDNSSPVVNLIG